MSKPIDIDVGMNSRDFQRGTKDVEGALENVADALDDVAADAARASKAMADDIGDGAKDGARKAERATDDLSDSLNDMARDADRAGRKLGDEIGDGARDAEKSTDRLERSFKDLADASKRETKTAGDSMRKNVSESAEAAKQDLAELKDEAIQNASETFSSFDGSVDSFVDGIQGTFGGIVSNMGPMGAVIGGALALGIGVGVAKGEELAEVLNTAKERAAELAAEIIDADGDLSQINMAEKVTEWGLAIEDSREWFEFWQADAKTAFEVAREQADRFGLSMKDLALGLSGVDAKRATESIAELSEQIKALEDQRRKADGNSAREQINSEIRARQDLIDKLKSQGNVTEEAIELTRLEAEINGELASQQEAAAAAAEARTEATSALQSALDEGVASWTAYVDAETGAADPSAYIAGMAERAAATTNFNSNVQGLAQQFSLSQDEMQAILDQGIEFAPMLQSIIDSGLAPEFISQIQAAVGGGQEIIDGTPLGATVTADADTGQAQADLDAAASDRTSDVAAKADTKSAVNALDTAAKDRTTTIKAKADTSAATSTLGAFVSQSRTATVGVSLNLAPAERALAEFVNRPRSAVIDMRTREGKSVP